MSSTLVFSFGAAGALALEIVQLYSLRLKRNRVHWSSFYVVISILFASVGGLLAVALPATTKWGAIYVGVSTPVLVNTIQKKVSRGHTDFAGQTDAAPSAQSSLRSFLEAYDECSVSR
jgi:hypothetical protein